jgi:AraC family transcriptional regulator
MRELGLADTQGILSLPSVSPVRTSAGLGWADLYLSAQRERPYRDSFDGAPSHLLILHLDGPVTVRRGHSGLTATQSVPRGGLFLHPADTALEVELGGRLDTVHVYLGDSALQEAAGEGRPVRLTEEFGTTDPLLEQLVLALDGLVRRWEPAGRTYADQLCAMVAGQLARHHTSRGRPAPAPAAGLTDRQFAAVRDLMEARLADPLPLEDLAGTAGLSVSQFARSFKNRTGRPPHRYLMGLRVEQAARLLRTGTLPIADVAAGCGFSHQEHLSRVLRAHLGTTPAALRRSG